MIRHFVIIILILLSGCTPPPEDSAAMASITLDELEAHIRFLASDELEGRKTGERGFRKAAIYTAAEFRKYGLVPLSTNENGDPDFFQQVPLVKILKEAHQLIILQEHFASRNYQGEFQLFSAANVVGMVPGTDPGLAHEYIVVGAHLDHLGIIEGEIYNGAVDNASGCAVVLESAEALSIDPGKRPVVFILYCAEEEGLLGSSYFVNHGPFSKKHIFANINIDHAGRQDRRINEILVAGSYLINPDLKQLVQSANSYARVNLDFNQSKALTDLQYQGSDHYSFHRADIPSVVFSTLGFEGYHSPEDDFHLVDMQLNYNVARITYATTKALADLAVQN